MKTPFIFSNEKKAKLARILLYCLLVIRPFLFLITAENPEGSLTLDSYDYIFLSKALRLEGQYSASLEGLDLVRPPGYPLFLVPFQDSHVIHHERIVLAQLILVSCSSLFVLFVFNKLSYPSVGLYAAFLIALSPNATLWSMTIMSESLFTMLICVSSLLLILSKRNQSRSLLLLSGLLLGFATVTRPIGSALIWVWIIFYAIWVFKSNHQKSDLLSVMVFTTGALVVSTPWVLRNYFVYGEMTLSPVGVNTIESFNFAIVLSEATGITRNEATRVLAEAGGTWGQFQWLIKSYPFEFFRGQIFGVFRVLGGSELSRWATVLGIDQWTGFGIFRNLRSLDLDQAFEAFIRLFTNKSNIFLFIVMLLGIAHTVILLCFAAIGFLRRRSMSTEASWVIWFCFITIMALVLVTGAAGQARFRVPAEPFLAILAGYGLVSMKRDHLGEDHVYLSAERSEA